MKVKFFLYPVITFFIASFFFSLRAKSDIELIYKRVRAETLSPVVDDSVVLELITTIEEDGAWPNINYEDVSREGFEHRFHLNNLIDMARAYRSKSSKYYKKRNIRKDIKNGLKYWIDHDFICDNWWYNQIGVPKSLVTLILIMEEGLPAELVDKAQLIIERANIDADGARPGGDRIKIASIQAKNLLYNRDSEGFNDIVRVIESEIKYVDWIGTEYGYGIRKENGGFGNRSAGGRGIQYDYSFHHRADGVNNTLSYGIDYADAFVEWAVYTSGTNYSFSEEKLNQLIDYYLDGICKTAVFGKFPDPGAKNRSISRVGTLSAYKATTAERLLSTSDYRNDELKEIVDIRKNGAKPTLSHATYYWHSEHFSIQRPDFFTSVRMYSTRVHNMEEPYNSEGILNHYRGDGANHISVSGDEYYDIAPVFDYQKIPGITALQKEEYTPPADIQHLGKTSFVGAVSDGKYAAVAFDFLSPHDPLCARKSWFFFDDEYVCLGSGISSKMMLPVNTTLNQCLLRGDVVGSINNDARTIEQGETELKNVDWIYHDKVGYVFPSHQTIQLKNSEAVGSWWRINKQSDSPKDEVKLEVFKLWIYHGVSPTNGTYQYIVVPATTVEELKQSTSKNSIEILANNSELQAVRNSDLAMVQMVFYKSGDIQLNSRVRLAVDHPCIVLVKMVGDVIKEISVADPNRQLSVAHLSISQHLNTTQKGIKCTWDETNKLSYISIDLPQGNYAGSSIVATF